MSLWWLAVPVGLIVNAHIGAAVLQAVDHKDQRLLRWYLEAPCALAGFIVLTLWPYVAWKFRRENAKDF